ncbi:hypothetical protein HID58_008045 [Brassica napus]|uniref:Tafazzin family protein n=1 Tax=Brassica napus TaxID=3708 RepID=A0ABQ7XK96_BRANA|nr:hypothetical protein HID58_008045 [Brassica napus]
MWKLCFCLPFLLLDIGVAKASASIYLPSQTALTDRGILQRFDAEDNASSLQFVENVNIEGTLFQRFPPELLRKLSTDCLVMQKHRWGITPEKFKANHALSSFFEIVTTCIDENSKTYVSTVKAKKYPITGFQWHPEKNAFEWGSSQIPHSADAIQVTQYAASYLVSLRFKMGRIMEWAARSDHLGGIPRKTVITAVGAFARAVANLCNKTKVHNADTLMTLVRSRPPGVPLITVSNHMSTLDDPVMWGGFKGLLSLDPELARWVLAAEDICFKNSFFSYIFRTGKQLHTFPEGKVFQEDEPIRRLKWGTASLIARCPVTPIVLPIIHRGFDEMMPEKYFYGRRPPFPLWNKDLRVVVGEPIEFDVPMMVETAFSASRHVLVPPLQEAKWPVLSSAGKELDETAQKCLYTALSEKIQSSLETLRLLAKRL